jgi:signal transduction histidine kinase
MLKARDCVERHRGICRTITFHPGLDCPVAAHRESISRAVDNLSENALRYSESDVDVVVHRGDGYARVSVLDRGPGIPPAEVETLKMAFARGSASVGKAGAGLGLAIVERIAMSHGARFDLLPREEGGGTEARLELPLCSRATSEDKSLVPDSDGAGIAHAR